MKNSTRRKEGEKEKETIFLCDYILLFWIFLEKFFFLSTKKTLFLVSLSKRKEEIERRRLIE